MKHFFFIALVFLAQIGRLPAQTEADWIDQEIRTKIRQLDQRRAMSKPAVSAQSEVYDVTYYGLNLRIEVDDERLYGTAVVRGKALQDNLAQIELDFSDALLITAVGGDALTYGLRREVLTLNLKNVLNRNDTFHVAIEYNGTPRSSSSRGFFFENHNSGPVVSTLSEPYFAHTWFPCKDMVGDKADSVDITITVPQDLTAVSNGTLNRVIDNDDGTRTFYWQERYPIAVYLISIAVSNYTYWKENYLSLDQSRTMPLEFWVYPESENAARPFLSMTDDIMTFFASIWGEYPFINEKYGQAQFSWSGGMEHQTATSLGSFSELLVCHEMAHSWWGNNVTCASWKDIWLNEGFARYGEALWREYQNGADDLRNYMSYLNRPVAWRAGSLYVQDTTDSRNIFNAIVYDKGAWVLHMLRGMVGNDLFFEIFRKYRAEFGGGCAGTADFQKICQEVSGQNLDWFFTQWVYGTGQPHYKINWQARQHSLESWQLNVTISQIQTTPTLFRMPLTLYLSNHLGDTTFQIVDSLDSQNFTFYCNFKPDSLVLDPANWVLKNASYYGADFEPAPLPDQFLLYQPFPNPFNQTVNLKIDLKHDISGRLVICDLTGREVAVLKDGLFRAGQYRQPWQPQNVASGLYIVRFSADHVHLRQKVLYLK